MYIHTAVHCTQGHIDKQTHRHTDTQTHTIDQPKIWTSGILEIEIGNRVQGGEDPQDALSLQVISHKRTLYIVALLRKMTCNLRHPMGLRHVQVYCVYTYIQMVNGLGIYINTYIHIYIYTYVHMYICTYVHMYIYTYIHICTYVHIYIYTYIQMVNGWGNSIHFWYMRWLRLVGSLKTEVSFAKEPYKRDYILQKRPIFRRSLLIHIYRV